MSPVLFCRRRGSGSLWAEGTIPAQRQHPRDPFAWVPSGAPAAYSSNSMPLASWHQGSTVGHEALTQHSLPFWNRSQLPCIFFPPPPMSPDAGLHPRGSRTPGISHTPIRALTTKWPTSLSSPEIVLKIYLTLQIPAGDGKCQN